jgi:CheY-like chemotaxis protein
MAVSETAHYEVSKTILPAYGEGRRILVVDDEECMLVAMQELLDTLGYEVLTADSGEKAVRTYQATRPDAVIMDRNMPGMDGVTCMKRILQTDPDAKIILISGYDPEGPHGVDEHTRSIMAGYMIKPVDLVELGRVLEGLFGL